jgi:hypothetical protein
MVLSSRSTGSWASSRCPGYTVPFLHLGATRHILFPEQGRDIPFTIENYAYRDGYGRDTLTFVRSFEVRPGRRRRFDATMVYAPQRGRIIDFLGTHQHYSAELALRVDDDGALRIRTAAQHLLGRRFPAALAARAEVTERYDDEADCFRIQVRVTNEHFGPVFGYAGTFTVRYLDTTVAPVPAAVRPVRENPLP